MNRPATEAEKRAYLQKRDKALAGATMADAVWLWKEAKMAPPKNPIEPLVVLHKVRVQWRDATPEQVSASRRWLIERGYPVPQRPTTFPQGKF